MYGLFRYQSQRERMRDMLALGAPRFTGLIHPMLFVTATVACNGRVHGLRMESLRLGLNLRR